jgi:hypothetical protein
MPKPKIARRCPSCGASARKRAFFCPQCGLELDQKAESSDLGDSAPDPPSLERTPGVVSVGSETATAALGDEVVPAAPNLPPTDYHPPHGLDSLHRATVAAREVIEEDVLQRVEKLRKISTGVLDEAAYDPSLRFVLVAAALFFIFLIILVLSKLIG